MRAIIKTRPVEGFEYVTDRPDRAVAPGEVRIAVAAASPCGTDRELVRYSATAEAFGMNLPVVMGHEVSGTVIEAGANVATLRVGDRVAMESHIACGNCYHCRMSQGHNCLHMALLGLHVDGGFAERLVVSDRACYKLPDDVPTETGALFESAGVAVHAVLRSQVRLTGCSVIIAGAGPIGLALTQVARASGARQIVVIEPNAYRRGIADTLGAVSLPSDQAAVDFCLASSSDRGGFDVGFDCTGAPGALDIVLQSLRREATAVCIGVPRQPFGLDITRYLIKQGISLKGSFGRSLWQTWDLLGTMVSRGQLDLNSFVTHRMPLCEFQHAIDLQGGDAGKVLLIPDL